MFVHPGRPVLSLLRRFLEHLPSGIFVAIQNAGRSTTVHGKTVNLGRDEKITPEGELRYMYVQGLWRYPVKSMRGERLTEAVLEESGLRGDRRIVVVSQAGERIITARTHPGLLGLQGSVSADGVTLIEGLAWDSAEALALTQRAAGEDVRLVDAGERTERFDVLPLLVATDGAIEELGMDLRRLRPNIMIGGVKGQAEREWPGSSLRVGQVVIDVAQLRMRCVMTTFDPDTLQQDLGVLRKIVREAEGKLALDCAVAQGGVLREGDPVVISS